MLPLSITVSILLCLVGCAIAAYIGNRVRGSQSKRFILAALAASLLSWVFYIVDAGHVGVGGILPSIFAFLKLIIYYLEGHDKFGFADFMLILSSIAPFTAIFYSLWWFSRWRPGEMNYFAD